MTNVQATFAATLVDEWVRCGVRHAVVAPGSRSTPLALALVAHDGIAVHVHHDERAAAFTALGVAKGSGVPAVVLCTSGTAAAEMHAAVIEAHQARVPMVVCTADRPPELQHVGAPQTIDQTHLYGRSVRWFAEPGVADDATRGTWRSLAARAYVESVGPLAGPVHLNLAFRDPLIGEVGPLPPGRRDGVAWHRRSASVRDTPHETITTARGLIVAGAGAPEPPTDAWPILADPASEWRVPGAVGAFDALLRTGTMPTPEIVLRLGDLPASKVLTRWLASLDVPQLVVGTAWTDPDHTASTVLATPPQVDAQPDAAWCARWLDAEAAAQHAFDEVLASQTELSEPFIARTVAAHASTLVVSSSMPVRDVEWYARPRLGLRVLANRGANGIDGVVSTAVGVAIAEGGPVTALVGDIALLHDSNALLGLAARDLDLTIVVVDNRGGGIFSFLPQAAALDESTYELLFGTPHDVDIAGLAAVHGIPTLRVQEPGDLATALDAASGSPGAHVVLASTDRRENVAVHDELNQAVAARISSSG